MALFDYDPNRVDDLSSRFGLRSPNFRGLRKVIMELSVQEEPEQVVLDMATGVGKTYLLAALLEYAATQGVRNLLVVLPGKTVRTKTINNFTPGADGFIMGAEFPKVVITPDNFTDSGTALRDEGTVKLFLLNVHHLVQQDPDEYVAPGSAKATKLRTARPQETLGGSLLEHLTNAEDLFMVLDESHAYSETANTWEAALGRLRPAARVGLTATPVDDDNVIFRYSLREAIQDKLVKTPVVAMRREGYRDDEEVGRLRDAKALLEIKSKAYRNYEIANPDVPRINPIMLVSCRDTDHADEVADVLRRSDLFGNEGAVLVIHSNAMTNEVEQLLANVQQPDSKVRAIVQVDMLNQGWNVHNVAVLVPLRALASGTLTEQMIGRGLRLPYGEYTKDEWIDTLEILSHESINAALKAHGLGSRRTIVATSNPDNPVAPAEGDITSGDAEGGRALPEHGASLHGEPAAVSAAGDTPALTEDRLNELDGSGTMPLTGVNPTGEADVLDAVVGLGGRARDLGVGVEPPKEDPAPLIIKRSNDTDFLFPAATIQIKPQRLSFVNLDEAWVKKVANEIGDATAVAIEREVIVIRDGGAVVLKPATQAEAFDLPMTEGEATDHIVRRLHKVNVLMNGSAGAENRNQAPSLAKRLVKAAGGEWTPKRSEAAARKLIDAATRRADALARASEAVPEVHGIRLPKRNYIELSGTTNVISHASVTAENFDVRHYYNDWNRGMFDAVNFDAFATELRIARLLDKSNQIDWWTRLVRSDGARIEYAENKGYYPDFVACDMDGVHWIIEGKDDRGRNDDIVQAKRRAAERVLHVMEAAPEWQDTRWGYLIAYQEEVTAAHSWTELRAWSNAIHMV